jgi:t-SNARE complex subunit (syntaxin)
MTEARIERLERAIWEITQLAQELDDMGYSTFANEIDVIVANIEVDIQAAVEEMDNVA